ncbi:MAG: hypothetical protein AAB250_11660 [Bdellovibrionota bacterium]
MYTKILVFVSISLLVVPMAGAEPDWSREAVVPAGGRENPYGLAPAEFAQAKRDGRLHALNYPVDVSGVVLPYEPMRKLIEADSSNPIRTLLQRLVGGVSGIKSVDTFESRFGLHSYPATEGEGAYFVPFAQGVRPEHRMGASVFDHDLGKALTVSCAQCHSGQLFGRRVIGLTNRFTRANEMFVNAQKAAPRVPNWMFREATGATRGEVELFENAKRAMTFIGAKKPERLGLDTSLAQVALSLAERDEDAWATMSKPRHRHEALKKYVADSKPAVWWNVKYKNRWLADGSIVSGNPILTNFLWNELGRGTDLHELDRWFAANTRVIEDLTTAVFSAEAPRFTDFFQADAIPLEAAKRGQKTFERACARCHGHYEKAWDLPNANDLAPEPLRETTRVDYRTRVVNVGTDPQRAIGMRALAQLNRLEISRKYGIVVEVTEGYVPPPLVGIWARWPYFHNNSAPSLCAVLTPSRQRPAKYWAREAVNPALDFDLECNGYPSAKPPKADRDLLFDTSRPGLRNSGHDEGIFASGGKSELDPDERRDLIRFLQTL